MKVQDKVIIVTGGGSGMGREIVFNLLSKGAKVVAVDINETSLLETVSMAHAGNSSICTFVVDLTNRVSVEKLLFDVLERFGCVDGVINNAGIIQPFIKVNDLSYGAIERVMNINFYGTLYMVKTFLPHLLTRPEAHIVNISSMGGFLPVPGQTIYGASKAAVKLLTEGLNSELMGTSVNVTIVFPGAVGTNIMKNSGVNNPMPSTPDDKSMKVLTPAKAAEIIVKGMESNSHRVFVGRDSSMMDFFYRLTPKIAASMIAKKMGGLLSNRAAEKQSPSVSIKKVY